MACHDGEGEATTMKCEYCGTEFAETKKRTKFCCVRCKDKQHSEWIKRAMDHYRQHEKEERK